MRHAFAHSSLDRLLSSLLLLTLVSAPLAFFPARTQAATTLIKPPNNLGLVGYWSFNEGTGTIATDFSGNGNTGTLTSIANPPTATSGWTNGKYGKAINFDGNNDFVDVDGVADNLQSGSLTYVLWFKLRSNFSSANSANQSVFELGESPSNNDAWLTLSEATGELVFYHGTGSGPATISSLQTSWQAGTWYHIVATLNPTTGAKALYVNGVLNSSATSQVRGGTLSTQASIGRRWLGEYFNGTIDDVRIYSRALSASEVAKLYGSGAVKFTTSSVELQRGSTLSNGLVGHWTFDGPDVTTTVTDRSGQGNHAYFVGGATSSAKTEGHLGQALTFNGVDGGGVTLGDVLNLSLPISFSLWVKVPALPVSTDFGLIGTDRGLIDAPVHSGAWMTLQTDGTISQKYGSNTSCDSAGRRTKNTTTVLSVGDWHHVVGVIRGQTDMDVIVDGVDVGGSYDGTGGALANSTRAATFGGFADCTSGAKPFNGTLDDVRIYDRALTATEVKQLYKLGTVIIRQQ